MFLVFYWSFYKVELNLWEVILGNYKRNSNQGKFAFVGLCLLAVRYHQHVDNWSKYLFFTAWYIRFGCDAPAMHYSYPLYSKWKDFLHQPWEDLSCLATSNASGIHWSELEVCGGCFKDRVGPEWHHLIYIIKRDKSKRPLDIDLQ